VNRWLVGGELCSDRDFATHSALGIDDTGRIVAQGIVEALRDASLTEAFLARNRLLELLRHDHLGLVEVGDGDLIYRVCLTPSDPTVREVSRTRPMSEDLVQGVAVSVLRALVALHGAGMIHDNIGVGTVHVGMEGSQARAVLVRPAPLDSNGDAAGDLAALGWVLVRLLHERPNAGWRQSGGVKQLVVRLLDPSMPTSARSALNALEYRRPTQKRGLRSLLGGLVG